MQRRRQFLKKSLEVVAGSGLLLSPLFSWIRLAYAEMKKVVLPSDTPRINLIGKNPAALDTHKLAITPLKDFQTMVNNSQ